MASQLFKVITSYCMLLLSELLSLNERGWKVFLLCFYEVLSSMLLDRVFLHFVANKFLVISILRKATSYCSLLISILRKAISPVL